MYIASSRPAKATLVRSCLKKQNKTKFCKKTKGEDIEINDNIRVKKQPAIIITNRKANLRAEGVLLPT